MRFLTPQVRSEPTGRLNLLDALRFVAAIAVVAYHFTVYPFPFGWPNPPVEIFGALSRISGYGYLGVYLFFIISGFVISLSARGRTTGQFVASRMGRLLPAFWVAVPVAGILAPLILTGRITSESLRNTAVNLTMLPKAFGAPYVDGVYWTLWIEFCFYVIVGFLILSGLTYGKMLLLAALWPLVGVLVQTGNKQLGLLLLPQFAPLFAGGIALYLIYAYGHNLLHWLIVGANAIFAANTAALSTTAVNKSTHAGLSSAVAFAIVIGFFALVAIATLTRARPWTGRVGTSFGRLTYPLYLMHVFPGLIVIHFTHEFLGTWGSLLLALAVVLALAWVVNRWVEQPYGPRIRKAIEGSFQKVESKQLA